MTKKLKNLKLSEINLNHQNFRQDFAGPDFDDMVESVRQKGVLQPILVRPVQGKKPYELVFGARRYHAAVAASEKKGGKKTIPAFVEELSDSEAYDLMVIENKHRLDWSELEEAKGFKGYLDKNGDQSLMDLANRTGIKATFIRRRISILELPEAVLEAWDRGEIRFGYLEQLARLDDEDEIMGFFEDIMDSWEITSIRELKEIIDNQAIELKHARFNLKKEGCLSCHSNSDVQIKMFAIDAEKTKCIKPDCFKDKQVSWLDANWTKSKFHKDFKTCGYKFSDDTNHSQRFIFHGAEFIGEQCHNCDAFVTLLSGPKLDVHIKQVCVGEKSCFDKMFRKGKTSEKAGQQSSETTEGQGDQPRVAWHGEYFREKFLQAAIPQRFENVSSGELQAVQLALFALIKSKWELTRWYMEKFGAKEDYYGSDQSELFKPISEMNLQQANEALKAATLQMMLYDDFMADARIVVASHIGIDLAKEWVFNEEYLKKKHIPEILGMGERFGIFSDPKAKKFLSDELGKKSFKSCKKMELIKVFLESGVDLTGKVPDEILNQS